MAEHEHFFNFNSRLIRAHDDLQCDRCKESIHMGSNVADVTITHCGINGPQHRIWCFSCWREVTRG